MNIETITQGLREAITAKQAELDAIKTKKAELSALQASLAALQRSSQGGDAKVASNGAPSIRLNVLRILKDNQETALAPKDIVSILREKGYAGASKNLANNLGATLSVMFNQREEVKRGKGGKGYLISAKGLKALEASNAPAAA